eukprot:TRINITY_DN6407_c0_g1_i1.p1 TRINITY_DN6407_c0_g1~~TRINITY_DN6407_c0_g1_i1.p1  ORF type:complete len:520 (+),score=106.01 TRINITY_DN6407_c0_g1_i1:160-1560(+)
MVEATDKRLEVVVIPHVEGYKRYLEGFNQLHQAYREKLVCRKATLAPTPDMEAYGLSFHSSGSVLSIAATMKGAPCASHRHLSSGTSIVQINTQNAAGATTSQALKHLERCKNKPLHLVITHDGKIYQEYVQKMLLLREGTVIPKSRSDEIIRKASRWSLKRTDSYLEPRARTGSQGSNGSRRSRAGSRRSRGSRSSIRQAVSRTLSVNKMQLIGRRSQTGKEIILDGTEVNIPCAMVEEPDLAGWLTKQGGSGFTPKNWRKRWFVLKQGVVLYYKQPFDDKALGSFALPGYMIMPCPPGKRMATRHGFKIAKEGARSYYVCAETAEDMKKWMNAMSLAAIQYSESAIREQAQQQWDPRDPNHVIRRESEDPHGLPSSVSSRPSSSAKSPPASAVPSRHISGATSNGMRDSLASHSSASTNASNVVSPNTAINRAVAAASAAKTRSRLSSSANKANELSKLRATPC